jgi:hypothetical protein
LQCDKQPLEGQSHVWLRLGDMAFRTTVEALLAADGMLSAMFAHNMRPGQQDEAGSIIIERDPAFFHYIMRHVHGEPLQLQMLSPVALVELKTECEYFQLVTLADTVAREITQRALVSKNIETQALADRTRVKALRKALGCILIDVGRKYRLENSRSSRSVKCLSAKVGERVTWWKSPASPNLLAKCKGTITWVHTGRIEVTSDAGDSCRFKSSRGGVFEELKYEHLY